MWEIIRHLRFASAVILTTGILYTHTASTIIQHVLIFCFSVNLFFKLLPFYFLDTLLSPSRPLSFSIRFIFSIAFICLFPSHTRTIHHPVDRSIDLLHFISIDQKERERERFLNMSVCEDHYGANYFPFNSEY